MQPSKDNSSVGLIFPGQGSQSLKMLAKARTFSGFDRFYKPICDQVGSDLISRIEHGENALLNENSTSSLLTVLLSTLHLEQYRQSNADSPFFAGYSVGQWTAIYASGAISYESLIRIVHKRALVMNECLAHTDSGMLAVIGLAEEKVESACQALRAKDLKIWISNFNAPGQYSIAGTSEAIAQAQKELSALTPKKLVVIPVAGAWHSPLLKQTQEPFLKALQDEPITLAANKVLDNVTGDFLPADRKSLLEQLAAQVFSPVKWEQCIQRLVKENVKQFREIGYGNMLTKYGFFIDRSVKHEPGLE